MQLITALILFVLLNILILGIRAQSASILYEAENYSSSLKKLESGRGREALKLVYRKGKALSGKLGDMESLGEADYVLFQRKMRGFVINRNEVVFIEPDAKFFRKLAGKLGTKADVAFFNLLGEIKSDNVWAKYIEQQTDVSGCTVYGKNLLPKFYGKLTAYKKAYPKAYVNDINDEIDSIITELTEVTCACGDRKGVLSEFRLFIRTFPKDKNIPAIKRRLAEIQKSREIRFNCRSG